MYSILLYDTCQEQLFRLCNSKICQAVSVDDDILEHNVCL